MIKKTKSFSMLVPEYTEYRDQLLSGGWMTAVFDSEKNVSIYKPTIKGTGIYSVIIKLVGRDSLVNGYKLNIKDIDKMEIEQNPQTEELIKVLLESDILTKSYTPEKDQEQYELTVNGAKLFVAFFISNGRKVNTLPGDTVAKMTQIVASIPRWSLKFAELMGNIAKGFAAFDNTSTKQPEHSVQKPNYKKYKKHTYSNKYPGKKYWKKSKPKPNNDWCGF